MEIAEVTGKRHSDIMRDVRDEIEKLGNGGIDTERKFALSERQDSTGRKIPYYILTKEGVLQLAARYDAVVRAKLIELAMKQDKPPVHIDSKFLFNIAAQLEQKEKENQALLLETSAKTQIINELKPKADYTDAILRNKGLVTITQIAKDYGMSGQAMNELLHELKVQYKQSEQWLLYREHQDKGFTHSETIPITRKSGFTDITMQTKWTQKGRLFIYGLLKDRGILPVIEKSA
jgi:phage antirepressor YoqD-like protein